MATKLYYPVYFLIVFIWSLMFIPKKEYKEYFIYGVILGGLGDIVSVAVFQDLFHIIRFKNMWLFDAAGQNALSPICWTITMMLYLNCLPRRRPLLYPYVFVFSLFAVGYGYLAHNAGLFEFKDWFYPYFSFLLFLSWFSISTLVFIKTSPSYKGT